MSLEEYLRPVQAIDRAVQKQYTRIGQRIPEEHLYKITMALQLSSIPATFPTLNILYPDHPLITRVFVAGAFGWYVEGADFTLNMYGLEGKLNTDTTEECAINPIVEKAQARNHTTRLPAFLAGTAFAGRAAYELGKYLMTGEPMDSTTVDCAVTGYGLLALASSMYLKDQDPKLLKRAPQWKVAYRYARRKMNAIQPVREPVTGTT
jgi:hypothetical protein